MPNKSETVSIRFQAEVMEALQKWIAEQPGAISPSRSQAVDHLVKLVLLDQWSKPCIRLGYSKGVLQFIGKYNGASDFDNLKPNLQGIDHWQAISCSPEKMESLEIFLISLLKPALNTQSRTKHVVMVSDETLRLMQDESYIQAIDSPLSAQDIVDEYILQNLYEPRPEITP